MDTHIYHQITTDKGYALTTKQLEQIRDELQALNQPFAVMTCEDNDEPQFIITPTEVIRPPFASVESSSSAHLISTAGMFSIYNTKHPDTDEPATAFMRDDNIKLDIKKMITENINALGNVSKISTTKH